MMAKPKEIAPKAVKLGPRDVLTAREVANKIKFLKRGTTLVYLSQGRFPFKPVGRFWGRSVYDAQEVEAYIQTHTAKEGAQDGE